MSKKPVKHYLITLPLESGGAHMHGYLMTNDKRYVTQVAVDMQEMAEKEGLSIRIPMLLVTELDPGSTTSVRAVLSESNPGFDRLVAEATDFHLSVFTMSTGCDWDKTLMELH